MQLSELGAKISRSIEEIGLLRKIYGNVFEINENQGNTSLKKVIISNLPEDKEFWEFKAEINGEKEGLECLNSQNSTVETILLFKQENRLYVYMFELKASLTKGKISSIKSKLTCSLVNISLYLSVHPKFKDEDIELYPVGIVGFNDNKLNPVYDTGKPVYSELGEKLSKANFSSVFKTIVKTTPVTLDSIVIPVLFFQNQDWLTESRITSDSFKIDFEDLKY